VTEVVVDEDDDDIMRGFCGGIAASTEEHVVELVMYSWHTSIGSNTNLPVDISDRPIIVFLFFFRMNCRRRSGQSGHSQPIFRQIFPPLTFLGSLLLFKIQYLRLLEHVHDGIDKRIRPEIECYEIPLFDNTTTSHKISKTS
jgi:hypothetical protein